MFHPGWRKRSLAAVGEPFDVAVIGGGITGCGILLDATQRGLRAVLLERDDIASGTSSRSSKLIHGGLRYLKQMQLRVTRAACRERDRLVRLNPHLVREIRFLYPAYHGDRTKGWQVDLGLWMYDHLTSRPEKHAQLSVEEVEQLAPGLSTAGLDRALAYTDAMADDARLTLAVAATAHAFGASVLTRCEVMEGKLDQRGRITELVARDLESGQTLRVRASVVVNATGVWTDAVRERLGLAGRHLRPSRGAHLILPPGLVPIRAAVTMPAADDGRPVFLIPHPEGTLLGTTDLYHDGPLDDPRPTEGEVGYLLRSVRVAFPGHGIGRQHVLGAFAGLRPILDTHAQDPSEASREEDIWEEGGMLSVAGGKLTTWRSTAEEAVDAVLQLLPEERARFAVPCATAGTPLMGLAPADTDERLVESLRLDPDVAAGMARRLGALAWAAPLLAASADDLRPIMDGIDLTAAEVRAHLRYGGVLRLEDLLLRRVRLGMWQPSLTAELPPRLRELVTAELGWSSERWAQEEEAFATALQAWSLGGVREPK